MRVEPVKPPVSIIIIIMASEHDDYDGYDFKDFIIAVNMIDILIYFGPLILKTVELCLNKKVSAYYRDRDLVNMAKMTGKHQKLCDPL